MKNVISSSPAASGTKVSLSNVITITYNVNQKNYKFFLLVMVVISVSAEL